MLFTTLAFARTFGLAPVWAPGMSVAEASEACAALGGELNVFQAPDRAFHHLESLPTVHCLGTSPGDRDIEITGYLCEEHLCVVRSSQQGYETAREALQRSRGRPRREGGYPEAFALPTGAMNCFPSPVETAIWEPAAWPLQGIAMHLRRSGSYAHREPPYPKIVWSDRYTLVLASPAAMRSRAAWELQEQSRRRARAANSDGDAFEMTFIETPAPPTAPSGVQGTSAVPP